MNNRERTTLIKRHMRKRYGIEAKVRYKSFSMGDSLDVDWIGGPPTVLVKKEFAGITKGTFNGMHDLYEYEPGSGPTIEGAVLPRDRFHVCGLERSGLSGFDLLQHLRKGDARGRDRSEG